MQKYVQMSALDDKDVPSDTQWREAVAFMIDALRKQTKVAEDKVQEMEGPHVVLRPLAAVEGPVRDTSKLGLVQNSF